MCLAQKRLPSLLADAQQFRPGPSEGGDNWNFDSFRKHMVQSGARRRSVFFDATVESHGVSSLSHLSSFHKMPSLLATSVDVHNCTFITSARDFHRRAWISMDHVGVHRCVAALGQTASWQLWQLKGRGPREQLKWPISSRIAVYKGQRPQHLEIHVLQMCHVSNLMESTTATWVHRMTLRIMRNGTAVTPQIPSASNSKVKTTKDAFFQKWPCPASTSPSNRRASPSSVFEKRDKRKVCLGKNKRL